MLFVFILVIFMFFGMYKSYEKYLETYDPDATTNSNSFIKGEIFLLVLRILNGPEKN